jgi:exopolysaccharide biosynthesis polyprenyl glycosylphosphotransferase
MGQQNIGRYQIRSKIIHLIVLGAEILLLFILIWLSSYLYKLYVDTDWKMVPKDIILLTSLSMLSWIFISSVDSLYGLPRVQRYRSIFFRCGKLHFLNLLTLIFAKYVFVLNSVPVLLLLLYSLLVFFIMFILKTYIYALFKLYRARGYDIQHVMIVADAGYESFIDDLILRKDLGYRISSIQTRSLLIALKYNKICRIYPADFNFRQILKENVIDEVYLFTSKISEEEYNNIMDACNEIGVIVRVQASMPIFEYKLEKLEPVNGTPFVNIVDSRSDRFAIIIKYMSDYYISLLALVILFPVIFLVALAIKIDSKGPVLFAQERIGKRGRKFTLYKFRTMRADAEKMLDQIRNQNEADGPVFKIANDCRITRVGKVLRRIGFDEVPQFINVIKGEMSLIGPRPPLASEVKNYEPWQLRRLSVKPGITCSWQVAPDRNKIKFEKWMQLDLQYIDNWSLNNDFVLMFKTVGTFFRANGY